MSKSIVILTGAGISAESGIKTFRDHNGLWEDHRIDDVASIEGYRRNPRLVQDFYNARRKQLKEPTVTANAAHIALAKLEKHWSGPFLLVTQNVDDLHERGGSTKVLHMHGELRKIRCEGCEAIVAHDDDVTCDDPCRSCNMNKLRPHIVWFGEVPLYMDDIYDALTQCDIFLSIGTSGLVYPAAGFVQTLKSDARSIEVNLQQSGIASQFKEHRIGPASQVVPQLVDELLTEFL